MLPKLKQAIGTSPQGSVQSHCGLAHSSAQTFLALGVLLPCSPPFVRPLLVSRRGACAGAREMVPKLSCFLVVVT